MKHYYNRLKEKTDVKVSESDFNEIIKFIQGTGKLSYTFNFYHEVYDFHSKLPNDMMQKEKVILTQKAFRMSRMAVFGVLRFFREVH